MRKERIFKSLSPYSGKLQHEFIRMNRYDEWQWINTEKYKIKKYFLDFEKKNNISDKTVTNNVYKKDSHFVGIDPIFEKQINKDVLKENMIKLREPNKKELNCIPLGITEDDKLICIKKEDEMPNWFICGQIGCGKTVFSHRLIDYFYNMFDYKIIGLNDWKYETKIWLYPGVFREHRILGEYGTGLPIVMMVPFIKNRLEQKYNLPHIFLGLDWQHFIDRIDTFAELGASEKYLLKIKKELKDVQNMEEFKLRIRENMPEKSASSVRNKIIATFEKYHQLGMLNPKVKIEDYNQAWKGTGKVMIYQGEEILLEEDLPIVSLARIGLVPMVNTADLQIHDEMYQRIMKFWIDWIVDKKNTDKDFRKDNLLLYIDELSSFCSSKKKSVAISSVKGMIQRGRLLNIGCVLVTQNISEIQSEIVTNCKYQAIFAMPSDKDTMVLSRNLNLDTVYRKMIKELDKFECLLISKERPFIIYDLDSNCIEERAGIFKVRTFFSLGNHEGASDKDNFDMMRYNNEFFGDWKEYAIKKLKDNNLEVHLDKEKKIESSNVFCDYDSPLDRVVDQKSLFKKPRLLEGVSIAKHFYKKDDILETISYSELKSKGFVIVTLPTGHYAIRKREDAIGRRMVIHNEQPKDIVYIVYNNYTKRARLEGYGVDRTESSVVTEQMIKR